ncbi:inovirus Gp2 family protein [Oceanisphaera pacifica]|uniref:Inovirus Gp2 family protein n=1 Tax=Oceanisphaera pacifica TaxID=2818389 RepID=A0ABS3NC49_9GAMM|nr:inovirus Gp2 family protein [Oceanisphaera pacifica]MBO1518104.1 inovirus Gp2 family protein [Oceanisphaera pacifica]
MNDRIRVQGNTNLYRYTKSLYRNIPIAVSHGVYIEQYLDKAWTVIEKQLNNFGRVFAIRLDLRWPTWMSATLNDNRVVERFISSLKAKLNHVYKRDSMQGRVHYHGLRYIWARELGVEGRPHYHFVLLLNRNAYFTLGDWNKCSGTLHSQITSAWASALDIDIFNIKGLVNVSSTFSLIKNDGYQSFPTFFQAVAYLCKETTKEYGNGVHAFGTSRG